MSWIGRLFGTEKAISDITDKENGLLVRVGGWFNDLGFTPAERASWAIKQLSALEPFKIVQRVIAFSIMFVFIFVVINVFAGIWVEAATGNTMIVKPMLEFAFSDFCFWPIVAVLSLYMSGGVIPNIFGKKQ